MASKENLKLFGSEVFFDIYWFFFLYGFVKFLGNLTVYTHQKDIVENDLKEKKKNTPTN